MSKTLGHAITSMDAFGAPISLTFKGKTSFKTMRGGILTVIIYFLMFWQIRTQVDQLYTQSDPITSAYETSYLPETPTTLPDMKQLMTMRFHKGVLEEELDPRAIKFSAQYIRRPEKTQHDVEFE